VALGAGAAAGGWWLLGGVVLAGLLALCAGRPAPVAPRAAWLLDGTRAVARLAGVPLFAAAFAVYLFPQHARVAAVAVVLAVTAVDALGLALPRYPRGWLLGVLLVAAAGLVAVCVAISPVPATGPVPGVTGMFAAGAVMYPLLARRRVSWWLAGSVALALAVCAAALYQLGPVRLGLSDAPVRDVLAVVDGQAIEPLLAGVVVIATLPAALGSLARARAEFSPGWRSSVVCGLVAAAGAAVLGPVPALFLAATLALAEVVVASLLTLILRRRDARAVASAALAITLLAWAPPVYLPVAVVVIAFSAAVVARSGPAGARSGQPPAPSGRPRPPRE
jgi:hypothetical protein